MVEWKEEYESESILQHKVEGASLRPFLLQKGFSITGASWEPVSSLEDALVIVQEYLRQTSERRGTAVATKKIYMKLESRRIYHEPTDSGWGGLNCAGVLSTGQSHLAGRT